MKKYIVIGSLSLVLLLSLTFGIYQKVRADKIEKELVLKNELIKRTQEELEMSKTQAEIQKQLAIKEKQRAEQQAQIAEKEKR